MKLKTTGTNQTEKPLKIVIAGDNAAKSRMIRSFPDPLVCSYSGNLGTVADLGVPYVEPEGIEQLRDFVNLLKTKQLTCQTLVIDSLDGLQRALKTERIRTQQLANFSYNEWDWLNEKMAQLLSVIYKLDMNVVALISTKDNKDDNTGTMYRNPALAGSLANSLGDYFDFIFGLDAVSDIKGEKETLRYVLRTAPDAQRNWLYDYTQNLPLLMRVDFENDYDTIVAAVSKYKVPESAEVEITKEDTNPLVAAGPKAVKAEKEAARQLPSALGYSPNHPDQEKLICEKCGKDVESPLVADRTYMKYQKILCETDEIEAAEFYSSTKNKTKE